MGGQHHRHHGVAEHDRVHPLLGRRARGVRRKSGRVPARREAEQSHPGGPRIPHPAHLGAHRIPHARVPRQHRVVEDARIVADAAKPLRHRLALVRCMAVVAAARQNDEVQAVHASI